MLFIPSVLALGLLGFMLSYQISTGVGVWGNMHPVMWGWDIVNFVWWIGIGHAGTLISAILFLLRQRWRTAVNRAAEAMTIFAVMCAGIYPAMHVGRVWYDWWLFPIPNSNSDLAAVPFAADVGRVRGLDLLHGLGAVLVHGPDSGPGGDARSGQTKVRQFLYGFSPGWTGSNRHWSNYEKAYLHPGRPFDAAGALGALDRVIGLRGVAIAGWHTTIFPPYFVAGAIFSGFGMVLTLLIPLRCDFQAGGHHHMRHIDMMCKVTLATGSIVGYAYAMEFFIAWYSGNPNEQFTF